MRAYKSIQSLRFPWRFNDRYRYNLFPLNVKLEDEIQNVKAGFQFAIHSLLRAMTEEDLEMLQSVTEPNLYSQLQEGLKILNRRGQRLKMINEEAPSFLYFYNEAVYTGLEISRELNTGNFYQLNNIPRVNLKSQKMSISHIKVHLGGDNLSANIILKLDVLFNSACKLIVQSLDGETLIGSSNSTPESHKFRFETQVRRKSGVIPQICSMVDVFKYFTLSVGTSPLTMDNWIITDIDDFLTGNPMTHSEQITS